MSVHPPSCYGALAERAWSWVLGHVRECDQRLWLPEEPGQTEPGEAAFGMHSGVGGLVHAMTEIQLSRP